MTRCCAKTLYYPGNKSIAHSITQLFTREVFHRIVVRKVFKKSPEQWQLFSFFSTYFLGQDDWLWKINLKFLWNHIIRTIKWSMVNVTASYSQTHFLLEAPKGNLTLHHPSCTSRVGIFSIASEAFALIISVLSNVF